NRPVDANVAPIPPTVLDACGNSLTPTRPPPTAALFPYTTLFRSTYLDCEGNTHDWTYTYTVDMPDFTLPADDGSTVNCPADANVVPIAPTVSAACGNTLIPTNTPTAAATCVGDVVWVFTYLDCEG